MNAVEEDTQHAPISIEEYIKEQAFDAWCCLIGAKVDAGLMTRFKRDNRGLLVRSAPIYLSHQVVVPPALRPRVLHLAHNPRLSGHPRYHADVRRYVVSFTGRPWPWMLCALYALVATAPRALEAQTPQQVA